MTVAILTVLALIIRGIIYDVKHDISLWSMIMVYDILNSFILGVTIVVVAVPEGLPLAVTISLAYSVS